MIELSSLHEDDQHNLVDADGHIVIPAEKRTSTEVYSRTVGYLRPISQWNKGKKSEWKDRVAFVAPTIEKGNEVETGGDA